MWSRSLLATRTAKRLRPIVLIALCCGLHLAAQTAPRAPLKPAAPPLPRIKVNLAKGKTILGLPGGLDPSYPPYCSGTGITYLQLYNPSRLSRSFSAGDLYGIAADGTVTPIQRRFPQNVRQMLVRSTYAGPRQIATLISTLPRRDPFNDQYSRTRKFYIELSTSDGGFSKVIPLDLKFQPLKIAALSSGKFLVLGEEMVNRTPVLGLLDTDGIFLRYINLDARPYAASPSLRTIYQRNHTTPADFGPAMAAMESAEFAPYGDDVLFYQPGAGLPVHVLSEAGEIDTVSLHLPSGYLMQSILPDPQDHQWIVRAQPLSSFSQFQKTGIIVNPPQQLFRVDPETGDTTGAITVTGIQPGQIACAADGNLIAPHLRHPPKGSNVPPRWVLAKQPYQ